MKRPASSMLRLLHSNLRNNPGPLAPPPAAIPVASGSQPAPPTACEPHLGTPEGHGSFQRAPTCALELAEKPEESREESRGCWPSGLPFGLWRLIVQKVPCCPALGKILFRAATRKTFSTLCLVLIVLFQNAYGKTIMDDSFMYVCAYT